MTSARTSRRSPRKGAVSELPFDARQYALTHELCVELGAKRFLTDRASMLSGVVKAARMPKSGLVTFLDFEGTPRKVQRVPMPGRVSRTLDHTRMRALFPELYLEAVERTNPDAPKIIAVPASKEWTAIKSIGWNRASTGWSSPEDAIRPRSLDVVGADLVLVRAALSASAVREKAIRDAMIQRANEDDLPYRLKGLSGGTVIRKDASPTYRIEYPNIEAHPFARELITTNVGDPFTIVRTPRMTETDEPDPFGDPFDL